MAKKKTDEVEVICTCDRLPLADGTVLVRGQKAQMSPAAAAAYASAEKVANV